MKNTLICAAAAVSTLALLSGCCGQSGCCGDPTETETIAIETVSCTAPAGQDQTGTSPAAQTSVKKAGTGHTAGTPKK